MVVAAIVLSSYAMYVYAKHRSPLVDKKFNQAPSEIEQFYKEDFD